MPRRRAVLAAGGRAKSTVPSSNAEQFTGANGSPWPAPWVTSGALADQSAGVGRLSTDSDSYAQAYARRDAPNDGEVLFRWQATSGLSSVDVAVRGGNAYGDNPKWTYRQLGDIIWLNGAGGLLDSAAATHVPGVWYWARVRWQGTTVSGRTWAAGTTEPSTWQVEATDSSSPTAGNLILRVENGTDGVPDGVLFDDVTISPLATLVTVNPGDNIQAAIDANPADTRFTFTAGTYNVGGLAPKRGNVFDGVGRAAVLDGQNTRQYAFRSSTAADVTIRGFVIKQYNTPLQDGAVHSFGATGWTIENNQITLNAAAGVATDTGAQVLNNLIDHNGQEGYAAHGANFLYEGNEIAYNNENLVVDHTWEAGGGKAWDTQNGVFRRNYVHHNGGHGMWDDTNNIYITYDRNIICNNYGGGIYHEIGYEATIVDNIICNNGTATALGGGENLGWLWDAGIVIRSSRTVNSATPMTVTGNQVLNNYNGIALLDSPPGGATNPSESRYGALYLGNVTVSNNTVVMASGASGVVQDGRGNSVFSQNLTFTGNHYQVASSHAGGDVYDWLAWLNGFSGWATWQGYGNDTGGTFTTITSPTPEAAYDFTSTAGPSAVVVDASGHGHDFTLPAGALRTASGHSGSGLTKTTGALVTVASTPFGQTADRTVMCWAKDTNTAEAAWWARWQVTAIDSGAWGLLNLLGTATLQARSSTTLARAQATIPAGGAWHHYAGTYTQSTGALVLYIDGSVAASTTLTGPIRTDTNFIDIASGSNTNGTIDDLRIYNTALSGAQITAAMSA